MEQRLVFPPSTQPVRAAPFAAAPPQTPLPPPPRSVSFHSSEEEGGAATPGKVFRVSWCALVSGLAIVAFVLVLILWVRFQNQHLPASGVQTVDVGAGLVETGPPAHPNLSVAVVTAAGSCINCQMQWDEYGNVLNASSGLPGGNVSLVAGQGIAVTPSAGALTVALTSVGTPGTVAFPSSITFDATGRQTAVVGGSAPVTTLTAGAGVVLGGTITHPIVGTNFASVADCGALPDDATDDTAAIQTCINQQEARGGGSLYFPPGQYLVSAQLNITFGNIRLYGDGAPTWDDLNTTAGATVLSWNGPPGTSVISITGPPLTNATILSFVAVEKLGVLCNSVAQYGISMGSVWTSDLDVYIENCVGALYYAYVRPQLLTKTPVRNGRFRINGKQLVNGGIGVLLMGNASSLIAGGDTCVNVFEHVDILMGTNGTGVYIGSTDHNLFEVVLITQKGVALNTSYCVFFAAGDINGDQARQNTFEILACANAPVYSQGTESGLAWPSLNNHILDLNSASTVYLGTRATLDYCDDANNCGPRSFWTLGAASDPTSAAVTQKAQGSETLRVSNAGANHIILTDYTNRAYNWSVSIDPSTSNFRVVQFGGAPGNILLSAPVGTTNIVIAPNSSLIHSQLAALSGEGLRIVSDAGNHMKLVADVVNATWQVHVDTASGNLEFVPETGSAASNVLVASGLLGASWANIGSVTPPSDTTVGALTAVRGHFTTSLAAASITPVSTGDLVLKPGASGQVLVGSGAPLAVASTAGFLGVPLVSGTPTGVPVDIGSNYAALAFDPVAMKLWSYTTAAGAWKSVTFA